MLKRKGATMQRRQGLRLGFTVLELVVLIASLVLVVIVVPKLARPRVCSYGPRCPSNQKQIGLAFRMWANDNEEKYPMQLKADEGGTRESALQGLSLPSFGIISNELCNPRVLACPRDQQRTRATNFPQLAVTNVSYFLGVDASETNPASIICGDRNLFIAGQLSIGLVQIVNPRSVMWDSRIHTNLGHITLADGSVFQTDSNRLQKALAKSGLGTNRFAIP